MPVLTTEKHALTTLEKMKSLRQALIFSHCKTEQLLKLAAIAEEEHFPSGHIIFRENDAGDSLYHLVRGRVTLRREQAGFEREVGQGESFGTLALLDGQPRSVDAMAETDVLALRIDGDDFLDLLAENIELVQGIVSRLTQEIRSYRYGRMQ